MSEAVIVAVLGFLGTVIGSVIGVLTANRLVNYRLEQLEKKVDKHNNLVERTYHLEQDVELLKKDRDYIQEETEHIEVKKG